MRRIPAKGPLRALRDRSACAKAPELALFGIAGTAAGVSAAGSPSSLRGSNQINLQLRQTSTDGPPGPLLTSIIGSWHEGQGGPGVPRRSLAAVQIWLTVSLATVLRSSPMPTKRPWHCVQIQ